MFSIVTILVADVECNVRPIGAVGSALPVGGIEQTKLTGYRLDIPTQRVDSDGPRVGRVKLFSDIGEFIDRWGGGREHMSDFIT